MLYGNLYENLRLFLEMFINDVITSIFMIIDLILVVFAYFVVFFFLFWKFYFLRNPKRKIPSKAGIISPADGKVLKVIRFKGKKTTIRKGDGKRGRIKGKIKMLLEDIDKEGSIVSIFMSPLDVHYNRSPISGKVIYQKHTKGKFHMAFDFIKSLENEKNEIIIKNKNTKIKVIQIAGFLARRIESFVKKGDNLKRGQVFGLINLGSQVTLVFPKNIKVLVKEGQKVKAGETIIAK